MKTKIAVILLFSSLIAVFSALPASAASPSKVTVTGLGIYEAEPDCGELCFNIDARADTEENARKALEKKTETILKAVNGFGNISSDSFFSYTDCNGETVVQRSYTLSSTTPSKLKEASEKLIKAGASSVCAPFYYLKNRSEAEKKALELAIADAKERAKTCGASGEPVALRDLSHNDCCRFIYIPCTDGKVIIEARVMLSFKSDKQN